MLILGTKITRPQIRSQLVARPRLFALLDQTTERPLTLLSAPAGFGKTTLHVAWASQNAVPVAWFSLDAGDNDPERFLAHFITSAIHKNVQNGMAALAMLQSSPHPPENTILGAFINDLAVSTEHLVLVLEDYQVITAPAIHDMLAFLLDHLPSRIHLVIATRVDPVLPLARLRARNQLLDMPWHISRVHPDYKADVGPPPQETLLRAVEVGKEEGLRYVYVGNLPGSGHEDTHCPSCGHAVIWRMGYSVRNELRGDVCPQCGARVAVVV